MKQLTLNWTERASDAAKVIAQKFFESHRGAMRFPQIDPGTDPDALPFCVVLYGNDGSVVRRDGDPDYQARIKAYVANLYAGLANLLPEGAVEFGIDPNGSTWAILANFPWLESYQVLDDKDADGHALIRLWDGVVWEQWKSHLVNPTLN